MWRSGRLRVERPLLPRSRRRTIVPQARCSSRTRRYSSPAPSPTRPCSPARLGVGSLNFVGRHRHRASRPRGLVPRGGRDGGRERPARRTTTSPARRPRWSSTTTARPARYGFRGGRFFAECLGTLLLRRAAAGRPARRPARSATRRALSTRRWRPATGRARTARRDQRRPRAARETVARFGAPGSTS